MFQCFNWSNFLRSKWAFCFIIWKKGCSKKSQGNIPCDCWNKRLQCYDPWKKLFYQPVKDYLRTYDKIQKIVTVQGDDYTTESLLDYPYPIEDDKLIAIGLSNQEKLDADPNKMQQINLTANLDWAGNRQIFSLFKKRQKQF